MSTSKNKTSEVLPFQPDNLNDSANLRKLACHSHRIPGPEHTPPLPPVKFSTQRTKKRDVSERGKKRKKNEWRLRFCKVGRFMAFGTDSYAGPFGLTLARASIVVHRSLQNEKRIKSRHSLLARLTIWRRGGKFVILAWKIGQSIWSIFFFFDYSITNRAIERPFSFGIEPKLKLKFLLYSFLTSFSWPIWPIFFFYYYNE